MPTFTPEYISKLVMQVISAIVGVAVAFGIPVSSAEKAGILGLGVIVVPALVEIGWLIFRGHAAAAASAGSSTSTAPTATTTTAAAPASGSQSGGTAGS
jgi:hypothetical protein